MELKPSGSFSSAFREVTVLVLSFKFGGDSGWCLNVRDVVGGAGGVSTAGVTKAGVNLHSAAPGSSPALHISPVKSLWLC